MTRLKSFITNRIVISLVLFTALVWALVFHFQPFSRWYYTAGVRAYNSGDYPRAVRMLENARRLEPRNPGVLVLLGWSLVKTGKPARAEKRFMDASAPGPNDLDRQLGLAYAEIGLNRLGRAEEILNQIRKERPRWIETLVAEGFRLRHGYLNQIAASEFRQALAMDPGNRFILENLKELSSKPAPLRTANVPERFGGLIRPPVQAIWPVAPPPSVPDQRLAAARMLASRDEFPAAIAQYRVYVRSNPSAVRVLYELGELLMRTNHAEEAAPVFRQILAIDPQNAGGTLGLAEALAAMGEYREARLRYGQVLKVLPGNYEARQGLANVFLWTDRNARARRLFQVLADENPEDPVNREALAAIASRQSEQHWAALRPPPGAPPASFIRYDDAFLASHPADHATLAELAANQAAMGNLAGAISTGRQIADLYPSDQDAQLRLAAELAWTRHYRESIHIYQRLLRASPRDPELLQRLAQVALWADRLPAALQWDQRLLRLQPGNSELMLRIADLETRLERYSDARATLATLATLQPENRAAQLGLASMDERQGDWSGARRRYQEVLARYPDDAVALYGDARLAYWHGDLAAALDEANRLIRLNPANTDALLLAARIENARGRRQAARTLVARVARMAPDNADALDIERSLRRESTVTVHTSSTYSREAGPVTSYFSPQGRLVKRIPNQDLNAYSNSVTIGFSWLPRSQSIFSLASMPSNSPYGGIRGAVGPAEFQYRQSTRVTSFLTLRGAIGLERFGPAQSGPLPGPSIGLPPSLISVPVTRIAAVGYGGITIRPTPQLSLDLGFSRDGVPYTPLSVRFGVVQTRRVIGLRDELDRRDHVHLTWYHDNYRSALWYLVNPGPGLPALEENGFDQANGGTLDYDRTLFQSERFSLGAGYSGEMFGYAGPRRAVYMGFFNPDFYQRHFATASSKGRIWGPITYQFAGGCGLQQLAHHQPFIPAFQLNPSLSLRVNSRFSITLGYIHYNFSQALGPLTGNAIQISTDSKFW